MLDVKMKVLLITQYFYPEDFKSNDMAFGLTKKGHRVTVLTGIPNYPSGKYFAGYGIFKNRKQTINGVKVIRSFLLPRGKAGGLRLALNYFSWAFFASVRVFFHTIFNKYDVILGHEPSPITQGIPCVVAKKMCKAPLYFWVLDLWPESLASAGGLSNKYILNFFLGITRFIYNNSDKILISSRGFEKSILEKGDYKHKLLYFPNWAEDVFINKNEYCIPPLPTGFKIMFAGNIGEAQDMDNIMKAALLLKNRTDIKFIFVGDGRKKSYIDSFILDNELKETVFTMGRYPIEAMPAFFSEADIMLLTLKDEMIFNVTVPAKLQAYMAAQKPIIAMLNGEGANIIFDAKCGYSVAAGDYCGLAEKITFMESIDKKERENLGNNGRVYFENNFSLNLSIDRLCKIIEDK